MMMRLALSIAYWGKSKLVKTLDSRVCINSTDHSWDIFMQRRGWPSDPFNERSGKKSVGKQKVTKAVSDPKGG
jgi:hypothetical protein